MSFRLEMLQVARLAPDLLGESTGLVSEFVQSQQNPDGGFRNRDGRSDLYYTIFGMESLMALRVEPDWNALRPYFDSFGDGAELDFVHTCCLLRGLSACRNVPLNLRQTLQHRIESHRTRDGGYHQKKGAKSGTAYGCLLGWSAYADFQERPPSAESLTKCLSSLRCDDGGYANELDLPLGSTPATAAAVALTRYLRRTPDSALGTWILRQLHPQGGFLAFPEAPMPDLLSTAVALHALDAMQVSFAACKELCLDFIDTLWSAEGGFHGHWADDFLDVEYTFYGLLALGHLSL